MGKDHRGQPSGTNTSESNTGIPTVMTPENMPNDTQKTERYTDDDNDIANDVRTGHPNRNTDKDDSTNAGGYKS